MCRFAGNGKSEEFLQGGGSVERSLGDVTVTMERCAECGFLGFAPPTQQVVDTYFSTTWRKNSADWNNAETDFAKWRRSERAERILQIVQPFGHDLLSVFHEVECGFGGTVFELQSLGIAASGNDRDAAAIAEGKALGVLDTHAGRNGKVLNELPCKPNVIYSFNGIDRATDPVEYLGTLSDGLAGGGIIVMIIPNAMAIYPLVYGYARYDWCAYPDHLHYFTATSIGCVARSAGLEVLSVTSRKFDVAPELVELAIGARADSEVAKSLREHMIETSMMGEELVVVLGASSLADRFPAEVAVARAACERSKVLEVAQRERGEYAFLPDPWAE